jgi:hypothetical protein
LAETSPKKNAAFSRKAAFFYQGFQLAAHIFNTVLQDSNPHRKRLLPGAAAAPINFFASGPIRVIGGVIIAFRMGHQTEYTPAGVTDTGNVIDRPVGIEGKASLGRSAVWQGISQGYLIVFAQFRQRGFISKKFAFTVAHRKLRQVDSPGEYAG